MHRHLHFSGCRAIPIFSFNSSILFSKVCNLNGKSIYLLCPIRTEFSILALLSPLYSGKFGGKWKDPGTKRRSSYFVSGFQEWISIILPALKSFPMSVLVFWWDRVLLPLGTSLEWIMIQVWTIQVLHPLHNWEYCRDGSGQVINFSCFSSLTIYLILCEKIKWSYKLSVQKCSEGYWALKHSIHKHLEKLAIIVTVIISVLNRWDLSSYY